MVFRGDVAGSGIFGEVLTSSTECRYHVRELG